MGLSGKKRPDQCGDFIARLIQSEMSRIKEVNIRRWNVPLVRGCSRRRKGRVVAAPEHK